MLRSPIRVSAKAKSRKAKPRQWRADPQAWPSARQYRIDAPDMKAAELAAVREFNLTPEQRKRLKQTARL
jgi:hypothetical protein